ncbi:beta-ketoacyl synthase N-terminal-like domain-containing protein [Pseudoalteromonas sp. OOF1S-7]|uniref:beta-ketoacyl synthase N-terminal-like domain-containing protein n=1 Tax=Pseudoalteromonas sp. OOF1S-7 TaxID=2917757 RepID=UPI001EF4FCDB|nr:beta-ketoacyl synthase N-terminal-like domain-containing protein [Pseudoalteromonas sp. OOF1S-7]MCG7536691.1 hypothetical protein [Pseudoalteromonas sp. OOF1S-7]
MSNTYSILSCELYKPEMAGNEIPCIAEAENVHLHYKTASKLLGRKGLRYKDEATLMALVAAQQILASAPSLSDAQKDATAIIVSSNLGNVDTVLKTAQTIAQEHVDATSAMDLPNASSNSISASISIVNQLRGPNLMLCNGQSSGDDALQLAMDLIDTQRAERVLVIGVEVSNDVIAQYIAPSVPRFHGACGYLLESSTVARAEQVVKLHQGEQAIAENLITDEEIKTLCNDASGAAGVLKIKLACEYASKREPRSVSAHSQYWQIS